LTAIVNLDGGHCLILPLNSTFVTPLREFYQLVQHIKVGWNLFSVTRVTRFLCSLFISFLLYLKESFNELNNDSMLVVMYTVSPVKHPFLYFE